MGEIPAPVAADRDEWRDDGAKYGPSANPTAETLPHSRISQPTAGPDALESGASIDLDTEAIEHIVVDLRFAETAERLDATVELRLIEEAPAVANFDVLAPIALPNSSTDAAAVDIGRWEPSLAFGSDVHPGLEGIDPLSIAPLNGLAVASRMELAAKRAIDLVVGLLMLLILLPLMIVVAILVKTTSRGPVLYRSKRIGKDGEEFTFLKFRSMSNGAADDCTDLSEFNEQSGPVFKIREDPRVTPLGRFLRKSSIDETPQLIHVLSGKMSLVGPRPAIPIEVDGYDDRAIQRLRVKPGITCIWQVSGRSDIEFATWVEMDIEYIRSWTLLGDMRLLARTVPAVLGRKGAY
jgi:lipopolysaccharide/colanic/teichoic acid biosynthesis glycosyltransferase